VSPLEQVALAWQGLVRTARLLSRPGLWVPWAPLAAAQGLVVLALWGFAHPLVSWFMAPLLRGVAGEQALHYPAALRAMPALYAQADRAIAAVLAPVVVGAATALFADAFRDRPPRPAAACRLATRRAGTLVLAQLPFHLSAGALAWAGEWLAGGPHAAALARRAAGPAVLGGTLVIQSLFLYVAALVVIEGLGLRAAFAALPRTWERGFWAAVTLGAGLLLPPLALQQVAARSIRAAEGGIPELTAWLVVAQGVTGLLGTFVLSGGATLVYLAAIRRSDGGAPA